MMCFGVTFQLLWKIDTFNTDSEYWDKYEVNMKKVLCYVALFCMDNTFFVFLLHKKVQMHKK